MVERRCCADAGGMRAQFDLGCACKPSVAGVLVVPLTAPAHVMARTPSLRARTNRHNTPSNRVWCAMNNCIALPFVVPSRA